MENLSLHDAPPPPAGPQQHHPQPPGGPVPPQALGRAPQQPQQPQQLPPQMFTTAARLLDLTDST